MALLSFPSSPSDGDLYPNVPVIGQNQYRWSAVNQTWVLEGAATGVSAGTYGDANNVGQFTVDTQGRLTFAQNVPIASGAGGTVTSITAGTGLTGGTITATGTIALDPTAVISPSNFTAIGDILVGTGVGTFAALPVGTDGFALTANSACAEGVEWVASGGASPATPDTFGTVVGLTDATQNVGLGCYVLYSLAGGSGNVAMGENALVSNTTGSYNTAIGYYAGYSNTTGSYNTAIGINSFNTNTSGEFNNAIGTGALGANSTGCYNNALGWGALGVSDTGDSNVAVGTKALACNLTGSYNTALGDCALCFGSSGCNNVGVGYQAGCNVTSGCNNVAIGPQVQLPSPTADCQLALGFGPTDYWLTGDSTKAIKPGAGIIDCASSTGSANQVLMSDGANAICWGGGVTGTYTFGTCTVTICNGLITSVV